MNKTYEDTTSANADKATIDLKNYSLIEKAEYFYNRLFKLDKKRKGKKKKSKLKFPVEREVQE